MYLIKLILLIASALTVTNAFAKDVPPTDTFSSSVSPSETPIVISEFANCINKTYIYCSHHELTGDWEDDLAQAANGIDHFCPSRMIDPYKYYRTMWGQTQLYICNFDDSLLSCSSGEFWAANALLDDKCGEGTGGWMYRKTEDHVWSIGRDPTLNDNDFLSECGMW
ncbi:hypothetical protein DHEL01_v211498 [Diaporthe helianthi]|uniref:Cyanovirin-N domain-containing protein n=1 Tax=Diaporthe helianthi TaxID=158607 RepID=A0A2P5HIN4_DIAHE|nr:hypothetical protein DHEL01_v211498 [Diaporthe helianthi]